MTRAGAPPDEAFHPPKMRLLNDITVGEGESIPPSTSFTKTWTVGNCGMEQWPAGCTSVAQQPRRSKMFSASYLQACRLQQVDGTISIDYHSQPFATVFIPALPSGAECDVSIQLRSPESEGVHQSRWRLHTPNGKPLHNTLHEHLCRLLLNLGMPFGEIIWCIVTVERTGLLGITQQMAGINSDDTGAAHFAVNDASISAKPSARNPFSNNSSMEQHSTITTTVHSLPLHQAQLTRATDTFGLHQGWY